MNNLTPPVNESDHIRGDGNARVTLVEYGDFECSFCGTVYPILQELETEFGHRLRFVFRHFPLRETHPRAQAAALAAEAAGRQGKFWEMHNLIYQNQDALDNDDLQMYAEELGLDLPRFTQDLNDPALASKIQKDFMSGVRSGVSGTPTFFINGQKYEGRNTYEELKATLEEAMEK